MQWAEGQRVFVSFLWGPQNSVLFPNAGRPLGFRLLSTDMSILRGPNFISYLLAVPGLCRTSHSHVFARWA